MSDLNGKSVLITGAAGCIGATVVKQLREQGATPVVFDLTENRARLHLIMDDADSVIWEPGDITDYPRLCEVIKTHDIFALIHLAALQVPFCKADPLGSAKVNVIGTANILEAAREFGIKRTVYASSIAAPAMGDNDFLATLYGAHKICGEQMAAVYWQDWQVPSVCIRPGVIYGPGRDQGMSAAPTTALLAALIGEPYDIPFTGPVAFVHTEDAAARFIGAVATPNEGAPVFDMQGTSADMTAVAANIKALIPGAAVTLSGGALPFPHAADDGRIDAFTGALDYRPMADGLAQTLDVFKAAQKRGVLTQALAEKLIGKTS